MRKNGYSLYGAVGLLSILLIACLLAPWIAPYDPFSGQVNARFLPVSLAHLLGTDHFGRDIFSRLLYGGRVTLPASFIALSIATGLGTGMGLWAAVTSRWWVRQLLLKSADLLIAWPFLVIAMATIGFFGPGLDKLLGLVIVTHWAPVSRLVYSLAKEALAFEYVIASKVAGARTLRIVWQDLLPHCLSFIFVQFTFDLSNVILTLASLSFFGLGAQPPTPEWGSMLSDGRVYLSQYPLLLIAPVAAITLVVLCLNLIGEYYRLQQEPLFVPARWEVMPLWSHS